MQSQFTHDISPDDRAAVAAQRAMALPNKGQLRGAGARAAYDEIIAYVAAPDGVTYEADTIGGVSGWWCRTATVRPSAAILYLHGGWYVWGTAQAYRHFAGHVAARSGAPVFVADYRLAPEHPFPAALVDAESAYRGLLERGYERIALVGDSAGGGLALSLAARLSASMTARPVGVAALSPLTDLTLSGKSWETRAEADPYFTKSQGVANVSAYVNAQDARDPLASPLYGDFADLPPVHIIVGDDETLLDDSTRFADRVTAAGANVRLDIWLGMPHVFLTSVGQLRAADEAFAALGDFLGKRFM